MSKYIVIKDLLNIRNKPSLSNGTFIGTLNMGERVDLMDDPVEGEMPEGTTDNHWLFDNLNRFVSRAGVAREGSYAAKKAEFLADGFNKNFFDGTDKENESKWKVSWGNVDLEIWRIWKEFNTKGENIKVAVIDSGALSSANDLKGQVSPTESFSFISFGNTVDDSDGFLHGTKSAGVIAANGKNANSVIGVAPACSLVVYQLFSKSDGFTGYTIENFCAALKKAREAKVDIISMSFFVFDTSPELENEIDLCVKQNILLVASVGDISQSVGPVNLPPAAITGCFSVGAYRLQDQQRIIFKEFSSQSLQLKCLAPGNDVLTCGPDGKPAFHQFTSAAAPFVAGLFALIVSIRKRKGLPVSHDIFLNKLSEGCIKIEQDQSQAIEGFGVLEAKKYFELLTT